MSDKAVESLKRYSPKAAALLQLCRLGKCEQYGIELAEFVDQHWSELRDMEYGVSLMPEIEAYHQIAAAYRVRTALERWRQRYDEVDAEIVFTGHNLLREAISHAELMTLYYDAAGKMARDMLESMDDVSDGIRLSGRIHEVYRLTRAIPASTGRDFPYDRVLLGPTNARPEEMFRAKVLRQLERMVELLKNGLFEEFRRLVARPNELTQYVQREISEHVRLWGFTLEDMGTSKEEILNLELALAASPG